MTKEKTDGIFSRFATLSLTAFFTVFLACGSSIREPNLPLKRDAAVSTRGMIVSAHPVASKAGVQILENGGNAFDAALAVAFTLGVVEPHASGIGGGGVFLGYQSRSEKFTFINFRCETYSATSKVSYGKNFDVTSAPAFIIPGALAGYHAIHKRLGKLDREKIMKPAIAIAEGGFKVYPLLARVILDHEHDLDKNGGGDGVFLKNGLTLKTGDKIQNASLVSVLKSIKDEGWLSFYRDSALRRKFLQYLTAIGSPISGQDLEKYEALTGEPLLYDTGRYRIASAPPPFSGISVIQIMKSWFSLTNSSSRITAGEYTDMLQAMIKAFEFREKYFGDPRYTDIPDWNESFGTGSAPSGNLSSPEHDSTSHIVAADSDGNFVSMTVTLGDFFGSGYVFSGIPLNNQIYDFAYDAGSPNAIGPRKRPVSSMCPTYFFLKDQTRPVLVVGSPGGRRIPAAVAEVAYRYLKKNAHIQNANDAPRFFADLKKKIVYFEGEVPYSDILPSQIRTKLRGFRVEQKGENDLYFGGLQGLAREGDTLVGSSDPRRAGAPAGL